MSKRKQARNASSDDGDDDSGSDTSLVDVDFEFFDPNPRVDYVALKLLLNQLFQSDAELVAPHEFAELILSQPLLGTTVKTDGIEGDPCACISVLNMHVHKNHPSIRGLIDYVLAKSAPHRAAHDTLNNLLGPVTLAASASPNSNSNSGPDTPQVGFVFSERLVNMPVQVIPPMYRMLVDEIQWANDDKEPYTFTHYLFISRTYRLTSSQLEELTSLSEPRPPTKRSKSSKKNRHRVPAVSEPAMKPALGPAQGSGSGGIATYSYHPEDEIIQKHAIITLDYPLTCKTDTSTPDTFSAEIGGRLMLVSAEQFRSMIDEMSSMLGVLQ